MSSKSIFTSVTFWAAIFTALAPFLKHFGINFSSDDANVIATSVVAIGGAVVVIWGRFRAIRRVHIVSPSAGTGILSGLLVLLASMTMLWLSGCGLIKKPIEVQAYRTVVGAKAFLDHSCGEHPTECNVGQDGKIECPAGDFCAVLNKAVGSKDLVIDAAEVYCAGPDFESGGTCNPPQDKTMKDQLARKLSAAIGGYSQTAADVRKAVR